MIIVSIALAITGMSWRDADNLLNKYLPQEPLKAIAQLKEHKSAQAMYVDGICRYYLVRNHNHPDKHRLIFEAIMDFQGSINQEPNLRSVLGWYRTYRNFPEYSGDEELKFTGYVKIGNKRVAQYEPVGINQSTLNTIFDIGKGLTEPESCRLYLNALHKNDVDLFVSRANKYKDFWIKDALECLKN